MVLQRRLCFPFVRTRLSRLAIVTGGSLTDSSSKTPTRGLQWATNRWHLTSSSRPPDISGSAPFLCLPSSSQAAGRRLFFFRSDVARNTSMGDPLTPFPPNLSNLKGPQCVLTCAKEQRVLPKEGYTCCLAMDGVEVLIYGFEMEERMTYLQILRLLLVQQAKLNTKYPRLLKVKDLDNLGVGGCW